MRVLFFPGGSYIGGMEVVTLSLMKELIAQGHACFAVTSGWNDGMYSAKLTEAGIPHRSIKLGRLYFSRPLWNVDGLVNLPQAVRDLRAVIRDFQPDAVVLTSIEFAMTALQVLPKRLSVMLHVHDVPNKHWKSWMGRYVRARTHGVLCVSDFVRDKVAAIAENGQLAVTVHNGVAAVEPIEVAHYDKVRIGIVGQLIPRKKHDVLVDAVGLLSPKERSQLEVRIFGASTTDFAREVALRIERESVVDCFRWMGFIGSQADIYGDLDVVVAPAVEEPFGLTVLEAGCWELPVIAARSGGFQETVIDGVTGLLVAPNDPTDLARALRRLLDPAERKRLGRAARKHFEEHFSVQMMGRNFIAALASIGLEA